MLQKFNRKELPFTLHLKFDPVYSKLLECYLTLMPLILYKPRIVAFICFAEEPGCTLCLHKNTNICKTNDKLAGGKKRQGFSFRQNIEKNDMRRNRVENDQRGDGEEGTER